VVVEGTGQIVGHEGADVALALQRLLEAEGIEFRLNAQISRIEQAGGRIAVQLESDAAALQATDLFVATGRRPNTERPAVAAAEGLLTEARLKHARIVPNRRR
jgi:pyruvate/2-oxoglutarate dehydrogenase complex dihydrolipoamide dehydrogenase (E3) component